MERRLAAIMATDVVGYSRLIRVDEEGTLAALQALRADFIDPKISEHHGRIVKLMGDGMLAEFPSVVDAVKAAIESQRAVTQHNSGMPDDKRIEFRVGINLGDVVIDGDDIQGDGVNVAARLEGLAQPGGICISGSVHEQVRYRLDEPFEDLGEQEIKNITRPVRVWQWSPTASGTVDPVTTEEPLPLPDKPSIAVLPFDNMSGEVGGVGAQRLSCFFRRWSDVRVCLPTPSLDHDPHIPCGVVHDVANSVLAVRWQELPVRAASLDADELPGPGELRRHVAGRRHLGLCGGLRRGSRVRAASQREDQADRS